MAITLNRVNLPTSATGANLAFTITSTTGNLIVVVIVVDSGISFTAVSDNKGNNYTVNATHFTSIDGDVYVAYAFGTTAGVTTINCTNANGGVEIAAYDLSSSTGGAFDNIAGNSASSANPSVTLTVSVGAFVAAVNANGQSTTAVNSGFTLDAFDNANIVRFGGAAHQVNSAGGSITCTFTAFSSAWSMLMVSIKEAPVVIVSQLQTSMSADDVWLGGEEY